jgi:8-oxo-dGTP pyrophosphatase MutT (NUDIX family)
MRHDETPEQAIMREAMEETGLRAIEIVRFLGEQVKDRSDVGLDEVHRRYFFHLKCNEDTPDRWQYYETDASDVWAGEVHR